MQRHIITGHGRRAALALPRLTTRLAPALLLSLATLGALGCKKSETSAAPSGAATSTAAVVAAPAKVKSSALDHLPPGCDFTVGVDVAKLLANPAMQKHIVPIFDEAKASPNGEEAKELFDTLAAAEIDLKKDIRSVAACVVSPQTDPKVVLVLGGEFKPDAVVEAAAKTSKSLTVSEVEGRKLGTATKGDQTTFVTQAADGAILFALDRALLDAAVAPNTNYKDAYGLTSGVDLTFAAMQGPLTTIAKTPRNPFAGWLKELTRATGTLDLAKGTQMRLSTGSPASAEAVSKGVSGLFQMVAAMMKQQKSPAEAIASMENAKPRVDGNDVVIDTPLTAETIDMAAAQAGAALREQITAAKPAVAK